MISLKPEAKVCPAVKVSCLLVSVIDWIAERIDFLLDSFDFVITATSSSSISKET